MEPLVRIQSAAVVLAEANVDTDAIFPARFLLLTAREGLGRHLFQDRRGGDFPLDQPGMGEARILIAGENFGCGSSREQAVWALADHGIRVVIAPGFAEIFFANCLRNGVLPIVLDPAALLAVREAAGRGFVVDVRSRSIALPDGAVLAFALSPERRDALLHGWDETGMILNRDEADIARFEGGQRRAMPWLHEGEEWVEMRT